MLYVSYYPIYHLCPSSALLEVAMARLAKYIWSSAGDSQARVAIVPTSLVTHLAERYGYEDTAYNVPNKAVECFRWQL